MPRDHYDILGIRSDSDTEAIKQAFRNRARELHPDVNPDPNAVAEFQELQGAYEVLSDPEKRARYDYGEPEEVTPTYSQSSPTPQQQTEQRRQKWNPFNKYEPERTSYNTDYTQYTRLNTVVGIITLLLATTFLIDFLYSNTQNDLEVISVVNKGFTSSKPDDLNYVIVETDKGSFTKAIERPELQPGERIALESSLIYGFKQYKKMGDADFRRVSTKSVMVYVLAVVVYIASLNAVFNKKRPERKFNAGIIAVFFSAALLLFALF